MVKKILAWALLAMLAVTSVGCTDGEEEENWWEVDKEEILLVVEFPGGNPERVERRMGGTPVIEHDVTVAYQNGELIVPQCYVFYKGEEIKDFYVKQDEEMYLTGYEEWTRWAELRAQGKYRVKFSFYGQEQMNPHDILGTIHINLTIV